VRHAPRVRGARRPRQSSGPLHRHVDLKHFQAVQSDCGNKRAYSSCPTKVPVTCGPRGSRSRVSTVDGLPSAAAAAYDAHGP
jgi:hypothetical protein